MKGDNVSTHTHKIVSMITSKNGKVSVTCACGKSSPTSTKKQAYAWFDSHNPFSAFARIFNSDLGK